MKQGKVIKPAMQRLLDDEVAYKESLLANRTPAEKASDDLKANKEKAAARFRKALGVISDVVTEWNADLETSGLSPDTTKNMESLYDNESKQLMPRLAELSFVRTVRQQDVRINVVFASLPNADGTDGHIVVLSGTGKHNVKVSEHNRIPLFDFDASRADKEIEDIIDLFRSAAQPR